MTAPARRPEHQRNPKLEALLHELNDLLEPAERRLLEEREHAMPRFPVVMVVGPPRCGSTLMMQWLARTGCFGYPSNLMSRFYRAPVLGAKIQQLLTDPEYRFGEELSDLGAAAAGFASTLGKTRGALAPNEFWYFWRRFIPVQEPVKLDDADLARVDAAGFAAELAGLEAVFGKPMALKAILFELNLDFLAGMLDRVLFLHIRRDPVFNAQSLLESREKYFGDRAAWYSVKPPEYEALSRLDPLRQVTGQVFHIRRRIEESLAGIDPSRHLTVEYEDFCAEPEALFRRIQAKFAEQGVPVRWEYTGPDRFESTNAPRLPPPEIDAIRGAWAELEAERPTGARPGG